MTELDELLQEWMSAPRDPGPLPGRRLDVVELQTRHAFHDPDDSDRWILAQTLELKNWC